MLKKINWEENAVFSLKLRDGLYTLVQMRKNHVMQFFDIFSSNDEWTDIDLGRTRTLHFAIVATTGLKKLFSQKIPPTEVKPSEVSVERKMLRADLSTAPDYSARLVELPPTFEAMDATEISGRLSIESDSETIYRYELNGMQGNPEKVAKRLIRYFDTGVNWDEAKEFLFKGIAPPPPDPGWKH